MRSKILAVSVLLLNLNGCTVAPKQAYEGTPLAPEAQVVLSVAGKHSTVGFHNKTYIAQVDGKSMRDLGATLAGQMFPYPHLVYLKPGKHTVEIIFNSGMSYARSVMWFEAEAGQTYTAQNRVEGYGVKLWIENQQGQPVGGIVTAE